MGKKDIIYILLLVGMGVAIFLLVGQNNKLKFQNSEYEHNQTILDNNIDSLKLELTSAEISREVQVGIYKDSLEIVKKYKLTDYEGIKKAGQIKLISPDESWDDLLRELSKRNLISE